MEKEEAPPEREQRAHVMCFATTVGRLQAITYFVSVILSFFVVIPLGITLRNFQGSCILFAQIVWDGKTIWPYSEPACDYLLYANLATTLLYAFMMGIYSLWVHIPNRFPFLRHHYKQLQRIEKHDERFRIHSVNPVFMVINAIIMCMVMSNAIVLTVGLGKFCTWGMEGVKEAGYTDINTCEALQDVNWAEFRIIRGETMGVKGESFYTSLGIATIASWLLFLDWVFQWVCNLSQSFTMCSCEVAEEKRKPDQAILIAARRSRLSTPSHTPGGRMTPPGLGATDAPMRPYGFRPQPGVQFTRPQGSSSQPPYMQRPSQTSAQQPYPQRVPQQPYTQRPPQQQLYAQRAPPQQEPYAQRAPPQQEPYAQRAPPQQEPYAQRAPPQQQPHIQRTPPQQEPMRMQQGYVPPRR